MEVNELESLVSVLYHTSCDLSKPFPSSVIEEVKNKEVGLK